MTHYATVSLLGFFATIGLAGQIKGRRHCGLPVSSVLDPGLPSEF